MEEQKEYWLNEFGKREWTQKENPNITAHRAYSWCDRVIFIDEGKRREYIGEKTFTQFQSELENWEPVIPEKNNTNATSENS